MKLNINQLPKFVINLDRRPDRLEKVKKEFEWMGWTFERFSAIDTGGYEGCAYSHKKIAEIILEKGYDYALVFEDDIFFMPYAKELILELEAELNKVDWDFCHLGPSIHRPLEKYSEMLIDLSNPPPKDITKHRGIFGTSGFILTKKSCELIIKWDTNEIIENSHKQIPIDDFFDRAVYPNIKSFSCKLPIVTQKNDFSDINKTMDKNHYLITYNWNHYMPFKLPSNYLDLTYCEEVRNNL
jgi:GR25 family glycosyltransferase involved in LPS biosynthesis